MKKILRASLLLFCLGFLLNGTLLSQNTPLIVTTPFGDSLWVMDTANAYSVLKRGQITFRGFTLDGINGMSMHPCTGEIYVIAKVSAGARRLAILDAVADTLTDVGSLGDNFAAISFRNDTILYGVTGNGANTSETLFTIDIATGATSSVVTLGNGDDGETICYNPDDGFIYHMSGLGTANVDEIFERINPTTLSITPITLSGHDISEAFGMHYVGNGTFLIGNINNEWTHLTTAGVSTLDSSGAAIDDQRGFGFPLRYVGADSAVAGICPGGGSVPLSATDNGATAYQWFQDGAMVAGATSQTYTATSPGNYNCVITIGACSDSALAGVTISALASPTVAMGVDSATICPGESVALTGSGNGLSPQWYLDGAPIAGANALTYTATAGGQYNLELTDSTTGCADTSSTGTLVDEVILLGIQISPVGPLTICMGDGQTLTASTGGTNYQWSMDGTAIAGATLDSLVVNMPGMYTVSGDFSGCPDSSIAPVGVLVNDPPTAAFTASADTITTGGSITFTDNSTNATAWNWDFGNGSTSTTQSPSNTYNTAGSYIVTLIAENPPCPADTTTYTVQVNDTMTGRIDPISQVNTLEVYPNPSRGEVNIRFELKLAGQVDMILYNATGQEVRNLYHQELAPGAHQVTWDGKDNAGQVTAPGVYIVRMKVGSETMPIRIVRY